jgi:C4-dicarboxylate transporter DctQ subunit
MKTLMRVLNRLEEGTLAFTLLGLALLAFIQVFLRYVFGHSFTWFEELSRYAGVFMTFLGASLGVKYGTHFSMDFFIKKTGPRAGHIINAITCLGSSALFFTLSHLGLQHAIKLNKFGVKSAAMQIPMAIVYLPIAVFSFTMALRFLIRSVRHAGYLAGKGDGHASGH